MRVFHATALENLKSIKRKGLIRKFDGVYLSDSIEGAARWKALVMHPGQIIVVVEVEIDGRTLRPGSDHSPVMQSVFGAGRSLVSSKSIPPEKIVATHLLRIKSYEDRNPHPKTRG